MGIALKEGILIAIEGIDGSGKSTQAKRLGAILREEGFEVVLTREPTDGPFGQQLRESAMSGRMAPEKELELFLKDRAHHVETLIAPALARGAIVITDRYYFSTVAYQGARGFDCDELLARNQTFAPAPDFLVLLDVPIAEAVDRIQNGRNEVLNEFEQADKLSQCREIFLDLLSATEFGVVLDGARDPIDITLDIAQSLVKSVLLDRLAGAKIPDASAIADRVAAATHVI